MRLHHNKLRAATTAAILPIIPLLLWAYSDGPPQRHSGAPGDFGTCTQCHRGVENPDTGKVEIAFPEGLTYTPGTRQTWTVTITAPGAALYGFQATARRAGQEESAQAGNFVPAGQSTQVLCDNGTEKFGEAACPPGFEVQFIEHRLALAANTFTFDWIAPAENIGDVRVYVAANAANGNRSTSGDRIYTASYTLTPVSAGGERPMISQGGVINAASTPTVIMREIASNTFVSIYGLNLAPRIRFLAPEDIVNNTLPTELDGVKVEINQKRAFLHFLSPNQINVLVPDDPAVGDVRVEVHNGERTSAPVFVTKKAISPALIAFDPEGKKYVAAVHGQPESGIVHVGKPGLFETLPTSPARPGKILVLFALGLGPTDPAVPAGRIPATGAPITSPVRVFFGEIEATRIDYAGLTPTNAGLYQINVLVPETVPDGDIPVIAEVGGIRTQTGLFVTVQRQ